MNVITDSACMEYAEPGHPESPRRIGESTRLLQQQIEIDIDWHRPKADVKESILLRAHPAEYLKRLAEPMPFDADTPWFEDIGVHARRSVAAGLLALDLQDKGEQAFSLMRPPGHHAGDRVMGFCYLNTAAIMALEARDRGRERVAVLDFDVHHGNGTEEILKGKKGVSFYSVHQYPCYPGTGRLSTENCFNYIVPPDAKAETYYAQLRQALDDLSALEPDCLIVSAGFDAYVGDPLAQSRLEVEHFQRLGNDMSALGLPVASILEGGYSAELGELILAYCKGLEKPPS